MKEKPILLGDKESMLGILSEPAEKSDRPLFLLLNAGIVHRIGPHRKTVQLARALAKGGFSALRFDLSGIGDSPARRDSLDFEAAALADIKEVCDQLERTHGVKRFVSMGLCSGADNTFQAATRDPRIVGAVLMDGYAYKTPRFYLEHYGRRANDPERWVRFGKRLMGMAQARLRRVVEEGSNGASEAPAGADEAAVPEYMREFPPQEEVTQQFQSLVDRGMQLYWLYTGGVRAYYNYDAQFFDCFSGVDFKQQVAHDFFASSNHTFTALRTQRELVDAIVGWAKRVYPVPPPKSQPG